MNKYILTAACGLAFSAASAQTKALPDSPNILLILVDDLGYGDLSCQGAAKDIQTPHIDKLLNEGVRFTNFHANCPVSSPSRASLLTGRYPDMVGELFVRIKRIAGGICRRMPYYYPRC